MICISAFPAIKVLSLAFIYKLAAAILQPLGGGPVITCLGVISRSVLYIFAALAIVSHVFPQYYSHYYSRQPHHDDEIKEAH